MDNVVAGFHFHYQTINHEYYKRYGNFFIRVYEGNDLHCRQTVTESSPRQLPDKIMHYLSGYFVVRIRLTVQFSFSLSLFSFMALTGRLSELYEQWTNCFSEMAVEFYFQKWKIYRNQYINRRQQYIKDDELVIVRADKWNISQQQFLNFLATWHVVRILKEN